MTETDVAPPASNVPGCLFLASAPALTASLAVQWFFCIWSMGMASGAFLPGDGLPVFYTLGCPTLILLGMAWLLTGWRRALRALFYGVGAHFVVYALIVMTLTTVEYARDGAPWTDRDPVLFGRILLGIGAAIITTTGVFSGLARRLP